MGEIILRILLLHLLVTLHSVCCTTGTETIHISKKEFERLKDVVSDLQRFAAEQTALNKKLIDGTQEIKEENFRLKADNLQRKKENENLVTWNERLKADNLALRKDVQEMEGELKTLHSELNSQRILIQDVHASRSNKDQEKNQYEEMTHLQNQSHHTPGEHIRRSNHVNSILRRRQTTSTVAFFAKITQPNEDHLGMNQNIIFEDVVTNYGNGYNNHHGVFIAPVSGLYCFTSSILSYMDREFWAAITVNGTVLVRFDGRGRDGRHGSGAQTAIVALKKGDDVSIQSMHTDTIVFGYTYSSFGGFLIEEFETDPSVIIG